MGNVFLTGSKIYLRPLQRADAPRFVAWVNDPQVTRTLLLYRPMTLEAEEEFLLNVTRSEKDVVLGIVANNSDALIGIAGLHQIDFKDRHAVFGLFIGEVSEWGKGYGTEATRLMVAYAFDTLNLHACTCRSSSTTPRPSGPTGTSASSRKGCCGRRSSAKGGITT